MLKYASFYDLCGALAPGAIAQNAKRSAGWILTALGRTQLFLKLLDDMARWAFGALLVVLAVTPNAQPAVPASGGALPIKLAVHRITESQYRHTIADIFGPEIKINARFEPEKREDGLLAVGNAELSLTSSGFEQYFALASSISDQALAEKQRAVFVPCVPANPAQADDACTRQFIEKYEIGRAHV